MSEEETGGALVGVTTTGRPRNEARRRPHTDRRQIEWGVPWISFVATSGFPDDPE